MLELNVPYSEKDQAKKLGAKWNPITKKWYVSNRKDYMKFRKWFDVDGDIIIFNQLYLVEGYQTCFKCKKKTKVISFALKDFFYIDDDYVEEYHDEIMIAGIIDPIPKPILTYITNNYNFKLRYSKTTKISTYSNCCEMCDILQGDFYLFAEPKSPFFIDTSEKLNKLNFYSIPLSRDYVVTSNYLDLSCDYPIDNNNIKKIIIQDV